MKLFIDCEFNEFKGELISVGIVAENGQEFYEVAHCFNPKPWVSEHVMPILNKPPVSYREIQRNLNLFLKQFDSIHLVADWPEDIKHFCELLIIEAGIRMETPPLTMEIVRIDTVSTLPHNALHDARAIALDYLKGSDDGNPSKAE